MGTRPERHPPTTVPPATLVVLEKWGAKVANPPNQRQRRRVVSNVRIPAAAMLQVVGEWALHVLLCSALCCLPWKRMHTAVGSVVAADIYRPRHCVAWLTVLSNIQLLAELNEC